MAQLLPPTELQPPREELANIDSGSENLQPLEEIQKQRLALRRSNKQHGHASRLGMNSLRDILC